MPNINMRNQEVDPNAHLNPFYVPFEQAVGNAYGVLDNPQLFVVRQPRRMARLAQHQPAQVVFQPVQAACSAEPNFNVQAGG